MMHVPSVSGACAAGYDQRRVPGARRIRAPSRTRLIASCGGPRHRGRASRVNRSLMHEDQPEDREPPVAPDEALLADLVAETIAELPDHNAWSDERFLRWLAEPEGARPEAELSRVGRRLMARAFCRKFGVQL